MTVLLFPKSDPLCNKLVRPHDFVFADKSVLLLFPNCIRINNKTHLHKLDHMTLILQPTDKSVLFIS